jgi:hypothetical protein
MISLDCCAWGIGDFVGLIPFDRLRLPGLLEAAKRGWGAVWSQAPETIEGVA